MWISRISRSFNSLFEIPFPWDLWDERRLPALSILFLRFYFELGFTEFGANGAFQFSFWDSPNLPLAFSRPIPHFQFSFWDSIPLGLRGTQEEKKPTFNSLFEIPIGRDHSLPTPSTELSILFLRFDHGHPTLHITHEVYLSILFLRFEETLKKMKQAYRATFNSLFEIRTTSSTPKAQQ